MAAKEKLRKLGKTPENTNMIIDIGTGRGVNWREGATPTIATTRAAQLEYWSTLLERQLT